MTARTVADLTPADTGRLLTLTGPAWSITGHLHGVSTDADWVEEQVLSTPEPTRVPTRSTTTVTVGPFTATIDQPTTVTVQEAHQ